MTNGSQTGKSIYSYLLPCQHFVEKELTEDHHCKAKGYSMASFHRCYI